MWSAVIEQSRLCVASWLLREERWVTVMLWQVSPSRLFVVGQFIPVQNGNWNRNAQTSVSFIAFYMEGSECEWYRIRFWFINYLKVFIFLSIGVGEFLPKLTSKRPTIVFRYGTTIPLFYILNLTICLQDYGTRSLVSGCRWLRGNTAYIFFLMMDAVSSCGTFVSTYHNGCSFNPEDVKIVFTCSPSGGPKTSCRLLGWKSAARRSAVMDRHMKGA